MRLKKLLDRFMYRDRGTVYRDGEASDGLADDDEDVAG